MKLSGGVEVTLHCALMLAMLPARGVLSAQSLAEFHGVSESYLLKHLRAATAAGLLESVSGPAGGYRLAKPADEITMLDVTLAIEGDQPAFRCTEIRQRGPCAGSKASYRIPCSIHSAMQRAEKAWRESLRGTSIAELAKEVERNLDPISARRGTEWIQLRVR
jgi:Rrf2 family protein